MRFEMRKKLLFPLLAILLLTPWPIAYAHDNGMAGQESIRIEAAESSAAPSWQVFGKAIGGVNTPGDLFYIDSTDYPADTSVILYLTNADELIHYYRYLILNVGVYVQSDTDQWERATVGNGEEIPETYIWMQSGKVSFNLPGDAKYKLTIDGGSFYCFNSGVDGDSQSPKFYLTAE